MLPLWDSHKPKRVAHVVSVLIALNLAVFAAQVIMALIDPGKGADWFSNYALVPATWWHGWRSGVNWIPLVSSMFLHGGVAHLLGNMWFLVIFGRSLEDHVGGIAFLLCYAIAGVGAAIAQTLADVSSTIPMVGASGAISGVLGAYFRLLPKRWVVAVVPWVVPIVPVPAVLFLLVWFAIQIASGMGVLGFGSEGAVAWWAHIGGFLCGFGLADLWRRTLGAARHSRRRKR